MRARFALLLGCLAALPVAAQTASPLTLAEVLQSSARSTPQIIEALARVRQAEGKGQSAEGAFDTVFSVDGRSRVEGYYDGNLLESRATRPLTGNGGYVYGGYRISDGEFPIYEDQSYTDRAGEVKVGALFALLRDRVVDERRTKRSLASADIDIARYEAEMTAIGVQRRAIAAYQAWGVAGLKLRAHRDLLQLAEQRRKGIERQVALGARASILLTENEQNLVKRQGLVVSAEQELDRAANTLSLYLRDAQGEPLTVTVERLPTEADVLQSLSSGNGINNPTQRPDYRALLAKIDQATAQLMLARNDLSPRLDLRMEVSKDLGAVGPGGPSRSPLDASIGFTFSVPLQNRVVKGRIAQARSEVEALDQRSRLLRDQIAVEVESLLISIDAVERLSAIAKQEGDLAERLAVAERRRFELGSGDFFLVNQREETANDARLRLLDAQARIASTRAELAAATADRSALQL